MSTSLSPAPRLFSNGFQRGCRRVTKIMLPFDRTQQTASPGGSWLGEAETDEGRGALADRFAVSAKRNCSPALIRLLRFAPHPPSPRGRHKSAADSYGAANFKRSAFFRTNSKAPAIKSGVSYQAARTKTPVR